MHFLIVEDESLAARRLEKMILELRPDWVMLGQTDGIDSTLFWLETQKNLPELIFLDIHLSDGNGFDLLDGKFPENTKVIFTTAFDNYAVQAFRVQALDYLLKPIKLEELRVALERVESKTLADEAAETPSSEPSSASMARFLVKQGQGVRVVDLEEVAYFYSEEKITFLMTLSGKRYPIDHALEKLETEMSSQGFFRVNRQYLVARKAIAHIHTFPKSRLKLTLTPESPEEIVISQEKTRIFKKWMLG